MAKLVAFGDVLVFSAGYAACWFTKDKVAAAIGWIKSKF